MKRRWIMWWMVLACWCWGQAAEDEVLSREYVMFGEVEAEAIVAALPLEAEPYAALEWEVDVGPGVLSAEGKDRKRGRTAVWLTVQVHEAVSPALRATFTHTCAGFAAKRLEGRWAWVLIGRVEVRVTAFTVDFESSEKLDALVAAIDKDALLTHYPVAAAEGAAAPADATVE